MTLHIRTRLPFLVVVLEVLYVHLVLVADHLLGLVFGWGCTFRSTPIERSRGLTRVCITVKHVAWPPRTPRPTHRSTDRLIDRLINRATQGASHTSNPSGLD